MRPNCSQRSGKLSADVDVLSCFALPVYLSLLSARINQRFLRSSRVMDPFAVPRKLQSALSPADGDT